MKDFVQLHRTFATISEPDIYRSPAQDEDIARIHLMFGEGMSWNELLKSRAAVVLGEAGTGKTREFTEQAQRLSRAGRSTFFIRLENLAREKLEEVLLFEERERLSQWLDGKDEGFFFLDSVDESRLLSPSAFMDALRHLNHALGRDRERAHVLVSCRISDWMPREDLESLRRALAIPKKTTIPVVQILPLNDDQRHRLLRACWVQDATTLLNALQQTHASHFAERPQDVLWLADHWNRTRKLGSLTELLETNIDKKLAEKNPQHAQRARLTQQRARQGATALAFAATLCRCPAILVPDDGNEERPGTLDPRTILQDWTPQEIRELLSRSLFDEATYGRVRFHHRDTREYLAARWLIQHLQKMPQGVPEELFIQEIHGQQTLIPSRRGIAGWVMAHDARLRRQVLELAPELFWSAGDPQTIALPDREQALRKLVALNQDSRRVNTWSIRGRTADLRRFAHPQLAPTLRTLLEEKIENESIRVILLEIIQAGALKNCAEPVFKIALDPSEVEDVRVAATHALAQCGTPQQLADLVSAAQQGLASSDAQLESIVDSFFPRHLRVPDCISLICKARPLNPQHYGGFRTLLEQHLAERCPENTLPEFLECLLTLYREGGEKHIWVPFAMAHAFARLIKMLSPKAPQRELLARTLLVLHDKHTYSSRLSYDSGPLVREALRTHGYAQRVLLRTCLQLDPLNAIELFPTSPHGQPLCTPQVEDWMELLRWALQGNDAERRRSIFERVLQAWELRDRPQDFTRQFQFNLEGQPDLFAEFERSKSPPPRAPLRPEAREQLEASEREYREGLRQQFKERLPSIASGEDLGGLADLYQLTRSLTGPQDKGKAYPIVDYGLLADALDPDIADAARTGWSTFWRGSFPEQYLAGMDTPSSWLWSGAWSAAFSELGLENEEKVQTLTLSDAEHVAFWALAQKDHLPDWFPLLIQHHPGSVLQAFAWGFEAELSPMRRRNRSASFIQRLGVPFDELERLCAPVIISTLERYESSSNYATERALGILVEAPSEHGQRLVALAESRARSLEDINDERLALWLAVWLKMDDDSAWSHVEERILLNPDQAHILLTQLGSLLERDWLNPVLARTYLERPEYLRPQLIARMYLAYWEHLHGRGGPWDLEHFWRDTWKRSESFWTSLPGKLSRIGGPAAHNALVSLAEDPRLGDLRGDLLFLVGQHRAHDANLAAMQPLDAVYFMQHYTAQPRTPHPPMPHDGIQPTPLKAEMAQENSFSKPTPKREYDVALSFAGEDRAHAEALAHALISRRISVFYDENEKAQLWGKDLYTELTDLYQNRAQYCVMFVSRHYAQKRWTQHERRAAQARAFQEDSEYILPIYLDDTTIPGLLPTIGHLDWHKESVASIADTLMRMLRK